VVSFSDTQITHWVSSLLLPLFRVSALLLSMPIIGGHLLPLRIRLYLALVLTALLLPTLPSSSALFGFNLATVLLVLQEVLNGLLLGFALQLFFQVFLLAGQLLASQMGLAFASTVDPASGTSNVVLGQFLNILSILLFLALGGHLAIIELLAESFHNTPIGSGFLTFRYPALLAQFSLMLSGALLLVLPQIIALLVVNLAFGVMSRAAPQLNIFSIGFALSLLIGLLLLWISLAGFLESFSNLADNVFNALRGLI